MPKWLSPSSVCICNQRKCAGKKTGNKQAHVQRSDTPGPSPRTTAAYTLISRSTCAGRMALGKGRAISFIATSSPLPLLRYSHVSPLPPRPRNSTSSKELSRPTSGGGGLAVGGVSDCLGGFFFLNQCLNIQQPEPARLLCSQKVQVDSLRTAVAARPYRQLLNKAFKPKAQVPGKLIELCS